MALTDAVRAMPDSVVRRHPLASYFVLTLGIVWATAPLAVAAPAAHGLLNAFNPTLVAVALTAALEGGHGVRRLLARLAAWRVPGRWYLAAVGLPVAIAGLAVGLGALLGVPLGDPIGRMPPTLAILLVFIWIIGPGEELGWRGFALSRLLADRSPVLASLVLGGVGAAFHLLAYVLPMLVPGHPAPGMPLPAFVLQYLALSLVWTWIFIGSRGSLLLTVLSHGTADVAGNLAILALEPERGTWIWTACVVVVALVVVRFGLASPHGARS